LSLENKILVYKVILKPVWTYGIQMWGTTSNSNLEITERFQSKVRRIITDAPWYIPNTIIKSDLQITTSKKEQENTVQTTENDSTLTPTT
jgi:ABC-type oligopeptide transport system substrate-binding subunit